MARDLIECVPNFSEGRDRAVVDEIRESMAAVPGVSVLDQTMDPDHHRSVITLAGAPQAVAEAAVRGVGRAVERIDLNRHRGAHPRIGACDVVPFVPLRGLSLEQLVPLARGVAAEIWQRCRVPVLFYEAAARSPERRNLADVRRGGFEALRATDVPRFDVGDQVHPTAGATAVGVRKVLFACNVNLGTEDVAVARRIARVVRGSSGGFPFVKALGLALPSRRQVQVSMNITDVDQTPVHDVVERIRQEAALAGVPVVGTEIIGLLPRQVIERAAEHYLQFENFSSGLVLENRLDRLNGAAP